MTTNEMKATNPAITVRPATAADRAVLGRMLLGDLTERGHGGGAQGAEAIERVVEIALSAGSTVWVLIALRHGLMPSGVLVANPFLSTRRGGPALRVDTVYVAPEARRRGVGRALLAHAAAEARGYGLSVVEVELPSGSEAGAALCRAVGVTAVADGA